MQSRPARTSSPPFPDQHIKVSDQPHDAPPRVSPVQVFVLAVSLKFEAEADRDVFVELFKPLAKYVLETEPETLSYELAIADTDPLKLIIYER